MKRFAARHFLGIKEALPIVPRDLDKGISPALIPGEARDDDRNFFPVPNLQRATKGGISRAVIGAVDQPSDGRGHSGDHRLSPAMLPGSGTGSGYDGGGGPPGSTILDPNQRWWVPPDPNQRWWIDKKK